MADEKPRPPRFVCGMCCGFGWWDAATGEVRNPDQVFQSGLFRCLWCDGLGLVKNPWVWGRGRP